MTHNNHLFFDIHVFCCVNQRSKDHNRGSCARGGAEDLRDYMKKQTKKLGKDQKIRINTAGCLDRCEQGPVMVIYPEGVWYSYHSKEDIDEIIASHMMNGTKVHRLLIDKA